MKVTGQTGYNANENKALTTVQNSIIRAQKNSTFNIVYMNVQSFLGTLAYECGDYDAASRLKEHVTTRIKGVSVKARLAQPCTDWTTVKIIIPYDSGVSINEHTKTFIEMNKIQGNIPYDLYGHKNKNSSCDFRDLQRSPDPSPGPGPDTPRR